jgi:hypothetical protein
VTEAQFISRGSFCRRQGEGDVDDHVLLASDESAAAAFHQDLPDVDAVLLGVAEERGRQNA